MPPFQKKAMFLLLMKVQEGPLSMSNHRHKMLLRNVIVTQIASIVLFYMCISIVSFMGCKNTIEVQKEFHKQGTQAGEKQTIIINEIPYTFCWCPPGQYTMGQSSSPIKYEDFCDVVLTQGFWMLESEITQGMWISIMLNNPSNNKGGILNSRLQYPVESVNWYDCRDFITKLNKMNILPKGYVFSLPTEAQWEYAACAGEKPFILQKQELDNIAWQGGGTWGILHSTGINKIYSTQKIKNKKQNAWNLYDMLGNVGEICLDKYYEDDYIYGAIQQIDLMNEFTGSPQKSLIVTRGGSFSFPGPKVEYRIPYYADWKDKEIGFRIVIKQKPPLVFSHVVTTSRLWYLNLTFDSEICTTRPIRGEYVRSDEHFVEIRTSTGEILKFEKLSLLYREDKLYVLEQERKNKKRAKSEFPDETESSSASEESQTYPIREDESKEEPVEETPAPSSKSSESADMKNEDLERLGVDLSVRASLNNKNIIVEGEENPGLPGFKSALYRDGITGKYILAFAGTDDYEDAIEDIWQGLGYGITQYQEAIRVSDSLMRNEHIANNIIITGHSLGGGLASAAACFTGCRTDSFNAAGLHPNTINNGSSEAIIRFNNATTSNAQRSLLIRAYYTDYCILSNIQDYTILCDAIGYRIKVDTDYDTRMAFHLFETFVSTAVPGGGSSLILSLGQTAYTMIECHGLDALFYGLLVDESTGRNLYK
ncbi:MAG: SUMF1/EgtB/PvdO family nonheme iron enzyme [Planctomycetia bacterium]|nr:SUMF1/EgtB/PvdO family nonheme iron enzyme [Planctomycetia bacterium]